jgi:hypothetical protein
VADDVVADNGDDRQQHGAFLTQGFDEICLFCGTEGRLVHMTDGRVISGAFEADGRRRPRHRFGPH